MTLTEDDVRRIAHLARLDIDDAQTREMLVKLQSIFGLIDDLLKIDTAGVAPMAHAQDVTLALREDRVTETDQHRRFQSVAPAVEDGLYLVPRVVE